MVAMINNYEFLDEEYAEGFEDGINTSVTHAQWIEYYGDIKCTSCGFICGDDYYLGSKNFCPNCGAKMDEVEK